MRNAPWPQICNIESALITLTYTPLATQSTTSRDAVLRNWSFGGSCARIYPQLRIVGQK